MLLFYIDEYERTAFKTVNSSLLKDVITVKERFKKQF